jgi:hypothetical protein
LVGGGLSWAGAHEPDGINYHDMKGIVRVLAREELDYFHLGDGAFEDLDWLLPVADRE